MGTVWFSWVARSWENAPSCPETRTHVLTFQTSSTACWRWWGVPVTMAFCAPMLQPSTWRSTHAAPSTIARSWSRLDWWQWRWEFTGLTSELCKVALHDYRIMQVRQKPGNKAKSLVWEWDDTSCLGMRAYSAIANTVLSARVDCLWHCIWERYKQHSSVLVPW